MKRDGNGEIIYSPSDLCVFFESDFASWMDRCRLDDPALTPDAPTAGDLDVYFDMEGYPFFESGNLEYLFGTAVQENGALEYRHFWSHDRGAEKHAFEALMDLVWNRFSRDRSMHVYHYGNYEVSALRELMGRHATREEQLDALLRAEVFVDLYRVVRQGVRIGTPSYSLKYVERLYRPGRQESVATAAQSVVEYARCCEMRSGPERDPRPFAGTIAPTANPRLCSQTGSERGR